MTRLAILGLLAQGPMHGYEIQRRIAETRMERWANILSGSIYFALNKMEEEGLVRAEAEERTGARVRKIYSLTERGRAVLLDLVREALASPPHSLKSDFALALGLAHLLPGGEVRAILADNRKRLEDDRRFWESGLQTKTAPLLQALLANDLRLIDGDIELLRRLPELLHDAPAEKGGDMQETKPTHVIVRTTGTWRGNPYTYEETVPIGKYEASRWWAAFQPRMIRDILRKLPNTRAGEVLVVEDKYTKTRTEFIPVVQR